MNNKQSFVLYTSFYEPIKSLPNEELGLLFRAIFEFKENGVCSTDSLTPSSLMAFNFIKNQFLVDDAKYAKRTEANRNNGLKGGRPITQPNPNNPMGFSETQITQPNPNDNVNGNDNGNGNGNEKKERVTNVTPKKVFVLPDWIDAGVWSDYCEMRARLKKPLTERAKQLVIGDLEKLKEAGDNPNDVLNQSVKNSWQGVFALKQKTNQYQNNKPTPMPSKNLVVNSPEWKIEMGIV